MSESVVIDSSALLALLLREPGSEVIRSAFASDTAVLISAVNVAEVVARLFDRGQSEAEVAETVSEWGAETMPFTHELAVAAGELRPATRHVGLSNADRACLALGAAENVPVLTADRAWAQLDIGVEIRLIR